MIDMRCLVPLDMETLIASAQKTGRVLIVEEDNLTGGWGAEVAARLSEAAFFYLDAPITRVAAPDTPAPTAPVLERRVRSLRAACGRCGIEAGCRLTRPELSSPPGRL